MLFSRRWFQSQKTCDERLRIAAEIDEVENEVSHRTSNARYTQLTLGISQQTRVGERKILGLLWDTSSDEIILDPWDLFNLGCKLEPTKCEFVSLVGKFYDPLGILASVVILFKVFLQELSQLKQPALTAVILREWSVVLKGIQTDNPVRVQGYYQLNPNTPTVMHQPKFMQLGFI